jgi:hypothetical protein
MINKPDIRFKSGSFQTAHASHVLFPLCVRIVRPTGELSLEEARRVVEQFMQAAEQVKIPGARLSVSDFSTPGGKHAAEFSLEQASKREVRLELVFTVLLSFAGAEDFWGRAAVIAMATDFLQRFSQRTREKDIEVEAQQGKLLTGGTAESAAGPRGPA